MIEVFVTHPADQRALYFGSAAEAALEAFARVRYNPEPRELASAELAAAAAECDVVIAYRQTPAPEALFAAMPRLAALVRCAMDIRTIDVAAASRHGVLVTRASAGFVAAVAEWVVAAMIDLGRGLSRSSEAFHRGEAAVPRMGQQLRGATLGIVGYGRIAVELGRLADAFGMRVVVSDPHVAVAPGAVAPLPLDELLAVSDFVVCLAAALPETENLFDAAAFARMKPGAFFVNASRGELVDDGALLAALDSGRLAGCAVDVGRAPDQMPSLQVARHPRVVATPHIGGLTPPAVGHQAMETVAQVRALHEGRLPGGAVNAEHATRWQRLGSATASSAAAAPG